MKRILLLFLALCLLLPAGGCGKSQTPTTADNITELRFKDASSYEELKKLDGKTVRICGYMATSSPVDGSFIFLMNLPYQSCPFCVPNTTELSNTMEVYPKAGGSFDYTTRAIAVTGKLMVAPSPTEYFTDPYDYQFNFKIVDAVYRIMKDEELGEKNAQWQKIAGSGLVSDLYAMYDYVNFVCSWPEYFVNSYEGEDGETVPGYYLYPADALHYLQTEGGQWNYGYADGYFEAILQKLDSLGESDELAALRSNVTDAKALAEDALAELDGENYTCELQYVEKFGREDYVYKLTNGEALVSRMDKLFGDFSDWLGGWEM